ncbi:acyl-CoA synthetase FdrA [Paenibacillus thiaminolyticus]|uniref:Acyl-CoA synthetase FdrA n=1 Tax=Paenibacillus thiaminolyticus TaxID=49283 RepID=A0AAP9J0C3_PANTH|nr:acyl-CoA synthetase FdrA [Paenibacillus thiaminolyticus]MCY9536542.1 acyl-CoA synthetase FdrA [Paenibacillus thiaminolyticus]MCY9601557.1 acyl-CoA synthetase FdrA [Paenibacillus thiaminolyticus]MCY9608981.1 acyl-CoA synthetase FdrA [Paenibacillus thiaminolyticus]MCY9612182.1 acyl-CoA synthetase FdrA [Paenibacillus thiaminolyticus]MCY9619617.1 acyl-CoA synthetase FdrA [Paenibacillus thiaminolyticus]
MLKTIIKENVYQDSVSLMLLTNKLSAMEGINRISVMMGTPANLDIFRNTGLYTPELERAKPNDICIVIDTEQTEKVTEVLKEIDSFLKNQALAGAKNNYDKVRTWDRAMQLLSDANLALLSIPGEYVADEAHKALDKGLHVFIFSDNVSEADELALKRKAKEKGLLVMGPDCGTGILAGVPIAFANVISKGNIGIVGASGTGIQEVSTIIDRLGGGVSHAIGTGGRDLSESIGALTMLDGIAALEADAATELIVVISKPPAPEVKKKVTAFLHSLSKPSVAIFTGEKPLEPEGNVHYAYTLEDTAVMAVQLAYGSTTASPGTQGTGAEGGHALQSGQSYIKGLYSGGTLATEAAMLVREAFGIPASLKHEDGYIFKDQGHEIIDLGDDIYTKGRPHPMIDPSTRKELIDKMAKDPETAVILFDVVLGYGSHEDMAGELIPSIRNALTHASGEGRTVYFVCSVCGTDQDPQNYGEQRRKLEEAGIMVGDSNVQAVKKALHLVGKSVPPAYSGAPAVTPHGSANAPEVPEATAKLLSGKPRVINLGLASFADTIHRYEGKVVQFDWRPVAGGNKKLANILSKLK